MALNGIYNSFKDFHYFAVNETMALFRNMVLKTHTFKIIVFAQCNKIFGSMYNEIFNIFVKDCILFKSFSVNNLPFVTGSLL